MGVFGFWATLFGTACLAAGSAATALHKYDPMTCEALNEAFGPIIFMPNETQYAELRTENWSQTAWRTPSCILRPDHVEQLQEIVPLLVQSSTKFAIRSGGHSSDPQAANIDGGVLIDLSGFDSIEYNASEHTAIIGSGQRWGEVYTQLGQSNVTVVGGRAAQVGVGGLTLAGGLSHLADIYGLACDNVVNFEVVLANGSVVNANQDQNSDLFWALKGGGNNFGIVTTFTLSTYPIHQVWGGIQTYTLEDLPALYDALLEYQTVAEKDPYAALELQAFPLNETIGVVLTLVYLKPEERPTAFAPFYRINATSDSTKLTTLPELVSEQVPGGSPRGIRRVDWSTTSFVPNEALYTSLYDITTEAPELEKIRSATAGTVVFTIQPISTSAIQAGRSRGGNPLGLSAVNQTWIVADIGWWWETDDALVHTATRDLTNTIEDASKREDSYLPYLFMNDASWDQDVIAQYGENNVQRMKAVQAQYDPEQVFQKLVPGGFKLPN